MKDREQTIREANAVVVLKEARDLDKMTDQARVLKDVNQGFAKRAERDLNKERERLDPKDKVDEEEVIVYNWLNRK